MIITDESGRKFCEPCERSAQRHKESVKSDTHTFHYTGKKMKSLHKELKEHSITCEDCNAVTTPKDRGNVRACLPSPRATKRQRFHA